MSSRYKYEWMVMTEHGSYDFNWGKCPVLKKTLIDSSSLFCCQEGEGADAQL